MADVPIYVKIDEYNNVLQMISAIQKKLDSAKGLLDEISALKDREDSEIESWKLGLEDMQKKATYFTELLQKPE